MASTRLRKAFHYPRDSDSDSDNPNDLDEEHQERLITELQTEDARKNALYRNLFLALPVTGGAFFLYTFLLVSSTARERLIALLSVSSLACTAYILHFMPIQAPDKKGKRPIYRVEAEKGPVERYLVLLNGLLVGVLVLAAGLSWSKALREDAWREALPAIIFGIVMFARSQMAPLNLEDLHKARYEYKGA